MAHSTRLRFDPVGCVVTIRTGDERSLGEVASVCPGSRIIWTTADNVEEEHFVEIHGCVVLIGPKEAPSGTYAAAAILDFPDRRRTTGGTARIQWGIGDSISIELNGQSDDNGRICIQLNVQPERVVPRRDSSLRSVS